MSTVGIVGHIIRSLAKSTNFVPDFKHVGGYKEIMSSPDTDILELKFVNNPDHDYVASDATLVFDITTFGRFLVFFLSKYLFLFIIMKP
jgi:hypothetical protein